MSSFPIWLSFIHFSGWIKFWLEFPVQYCIALMKVDIIALFLIMEESAQSFFIDQHFNCEFLIKTLFHVEEVSFYSQFTETTVEQAGMWDLNAASQTLISEPSAPLEASMSTFSPFLASFFCKKPFPQSLKIFLSLSNGKEQISQRLFHQKRDKRSVLL